MQHRRLGYIAKKLESHSKFTKTEFEDPRLKSFTLKYKNFLDPIVVISAKYQEVNKTKPITAQSIISLYQSFFNRIDHNAKEITQNTYLEYRFAFQSWHAFMHVLKENQNPHYLEIFLAYHRKLKEIKKIVEARLPKKNENQLELKDFLNDKLRDVNTFLGEHYLEISKENIHIANAYYLNALEIIDEFSDQDFALWYKLCLYLRLTHSFLILDDIHITCHYLYYANLIFGDDPDLKFYTEKYIPLLRQILNTISERKILIDEKLFETICKLFPKQNELRYEIMSDFLKQLMKNKQYRIAFSLAEELAKSKIENFKKYGENCKAFLQKKIWEEIQTWHKQVVSTEKYQIQLDEKAFQIIISLPQANMEKSIRLNKTTYHIHNKTIKLNYLISLESLNKIIDDINQIQFQILKPIETYQGVTETLNKQERPEDIAIQSIPKSNTKKKTKKAVEPEQLDKEVKEEQKSNVADAEKFGFSAIFNDKKIYPLYSALHPEGKLYGYMSLENIHGKVAEETIQQCQRVLENGKIGKRSPCIKYVKKYDNTFKIAPMCDFRLFSHVAEKKDGKILLSFDQPETHTTQKKIL